MSVWLTSSVSCAEAASTVRVRVRGVDSRTCPFAGAISWGGMSFAGRGSGVPAPGWSRWHKPVVVASACVRAGRVRDMGNWQEYITNKTGNSRVVLLWERGCHGQSVDEIGACIILEWTSKSGGRAKEHLSSERCTGGRAKELLQIECAGGRAKELFGAECEGVMCESKS